MLKTDVSAPLAIGAVTLYLKQIGRYQEAKALGDSLEGGVEGGAGIAADPKIKPGDVPISQ